MGVKQSKRSVDITETSTKGEIEGFGNEGKVEKIIDGVVEKVAANGHVDGDLQNGIESLQNGVELIQNGEAAAVATELSEKKDVDEPSVEGIINGQVENGEVNGEAEKSIDEGRKSDEKKEKKKEKKEKVVKKKFSFRNFSFSKKDKSKPQKEEKLPGKVDETAAEETLTSPEKEVATPSQEDVAETPKPVESTSPAVETTSSSGTITMGTSVPEIPAPEKVDEIATKKSEDLPPPLPASPPPCEPVESKMAIESQKVVPEPACDSGELTEVTNSISSVLAEKLETSTEMMKNTEQIVMETGKQIEEKATNLLKAVEERVEESVRAVEGIVLQKTAEVLEDCQDAMGQIETKEETQGIADEAKKLEESGVPIMGTLEETADKPEEGAGESLADMPKDLTEEVTAATVEASDPDSLEIPVPLPVPPVIETAIGE